MLQFEGWPLIETAGEVLSSCGYPVWPGGFVRDDADVFGMANDFAQSRTEIPHVQSTKTKDSE